jgi:hypothetical protein
MEPVGEHVQLGIAPGDKAAVIPDEAVAIVEGEQITSHGHILPRREFAKLYNAANTALYRSLRNMSIWLT